MGVLGDERKTVSVQTPLQALRQKCRESTLGQRSYTPWVMEDRENKGRYKGNVAGVL